MKIIIGLGNPEKDYKFTRHNVGFETINKISADNKIEINKLKFKSHIGEGFLNGQKVMLVKPQTYMNLSGIAVRDILNFYKLNNQDIIVIFDECNLDIGNIRIRERGSAGGHNGIKSIIENLQTDEFLRIKIGIDNKPSYMDLADYVLSRFSRSEQDKIDQAIESAADAVSIVLKDGITKAMNLYNTKNKT